MAVILLASCKKDNSLKSITPQVSFGIHADGFTTTLPSFGAATAKTASLTWTAGTANISGFELEAKKGSVDTEIQADQLTDIDLFNSTPKLISAVITRGIYSGIDVKVILSKSATAAIPLVLKGNFKNAAGNIIPVEFDFNDDAVIKVALTNVVVDGTKDLSTLISIHLNKLMANVTAAEIDTASRTNNIVVISSTQNSSIYQKVTSALTSACDSEGFEKHDKSSR